MDVRSVKIKNKKIVRDLLMAFRTKNILCVDVHVLFVSDIAE